MKKLLFTIAAVASFTAMSAQSTVTVTGAGNNVDTDVATHTVAVDLPAIAMLDIHSTSINDGINAVGAELTEIVWNIDAGDVTEAGEFLNFASLPKVKVSVNHTYVPAADGQLATVDVEISNVIPGFNVVATVGSDVGVSVGVPGSPVLGAITLTQASQTVRSGILASYTEQGVNKGTEIEYSLTENIADFGGLYAGGTADMQAIVTYTLAGI